jgi:hypothetical protein
MIPLAATIQPTAVYIQWWLCLQGVGLPQLVHTLHRSRVLLCQWQLQHCLDRNSKDVTKHRQLCKGPHLLWVMCLAISCG